MKKIAIHWFRQDLRLADNPALNQASQADETITIYIFDKKYPIGGASKLWLHYSLTKLNESLDNKLNIYKGDPLRIIKELIQKNKVTGFYWNRCYDKYSIDRDTQIKQLLQEHNVNVKSFNGSLLIEPWECIKSDNSHYKVYTPFYKELIKIRKYRPNIAKPKFNSLKKLNDSNDIASLELLEPKHSWQEIIKQWNVGEEMAINILKQFLDKKIKGYKIARDYMSLDATSTLSPYLHFGEISPNQIYNTVQNLNSINKNEEYFMKELAWRDFCYYQTYYYPNLDHRNINSKFDKIEWQNNQSLLKKWQQGQTGIPIVDAGMRQLWQTGYMHNRVRMIVASFLTKNCLIHWKEGEKWFFDTLFDADFASNNANWQWVAGCGLDAAPYFRIFNPVLQAEKFEAYSYIRKYVSELKDLPDKYLAKPWEASEAVLKEAKITLGKNYSKPIINLKASRDRAIDMYKKL